MVKELVNIYRRRRHMASPLRQHQIAFSALQFALRRCDINTCVQMNEYNYKGVFRHITVTYTVK